MKSETLKCPISEYQLHFERRTENTRARGLALRVLAEQLCSEGIKESAVIALLAEELIVSAETDLELLAASRNAIEAGQLSGAIELILPTEISLEALTYFAVA